MSSVMSATSQNQDESSDSSSFSTDSFHISGSRCCPLCCFISRDSGALFQHINSNHITRCKFPDADFISSHDCSVCSECGFLYEKCFSTCRRSLGRGQPRCHGLMVDSCQSSWPETNKNDRLSLSRIDESSPNSGISHVSSSNSSRRFVVEPISRIHVATSDLAIEGVRAAVQRSRSVDNEAVIFQSLMDEIIRLPVNAVCHIPCSVRPLFAEVLFSEFNYPGQEGLWGFARLFLFAKAVYGLHHEEVRRRDML